MARTRAERRRSEYLVKRHVRDLYDGPDYIQTERQVGRMASVHGTNKKQAREKTATAVENVARRRTLRASN